MSVPNPALSRPVHAQVLADLVARPAVRDFVLVVAGAAYVAGFSQLSVPLPFTPIPLSLGGFAVLSAGAALGAKRAAASLGLFVIVGLAGAPVFAGGHSGFGGPTLGYLAGYIAAATLVGWLAGRGGDRKPLPAFGIVLLGSAAIHLFGVPYLAWYAGLSLPAAIVSGCLPFIIGDLIKAGAAAAVFPAAWVAVRRFGPGAK